MENQRVLPGETLEQYNRRMRLNNEVYLPRTFNIDSENNPPEEPYQARTISDLIKKPGNSQDKESNSQKPQGEQAYVPPRLEDTLEGGRK